MSGWTLSAWTAVMYRSMESNIVKKVVVLTTFFYDSGFPVVRHPLCIFLASWQCLNWYDSDLRRDADARLKHFFYFLCGGFKVDASLCLDGQNHDITVLFVIVCQRDSVLACHTVNIRNSSDTSL